jgi:hypothetical protein
MSASDPRVEPFPPMPSYDAQSQVLALAEQTGRVLAVANAMVSSGRQVDLGGLQNSAGLLCAKSLDLAPGEAGLVRHELIRLVASLDELATCLRQRHE